MPLVAMLAFLLTIVFLGGVDATSCAESYAVHGSALSLAACVSPSFGFTETMRTQRLLTDVYAEHGVCSPSMDTDGNPRECCLYSEKSKDNVLMICTVLFKPGCTPQSATSCSCKEKPAKCSDEADGKMKVCTVYHSDTCATSGSKLLHRSGQASSVARIVEKDGKKIAAVSRCYLCCNTCLQQLSDCYYLDYTYQCPGGISR